jgi:hypothetical protein
MVSLTDQRWSALALLEAFEEQFNELLFSILHPGPRNLSGSQHSWLPAADVQEET